MIWLLTLFLGGSPAFAEDAAEPTVEELLDATDDVTRGESSKAVMIMEVKTKRRHESQDSKAEVADLIRQNPSKPFDRSRNSGFNRVTVADL